MSLARSLHLSSIILSAALCAPLAAQQFKISLPKPSRVTPVQKLNQEGVKAVTKNDFEKAKKLFYRAYLLDPNDPFTLNNLGYIAELEGDIERAQRYYALAAENPSEARVFRANDPELEGKPVTQVAGHVADREMQVNRMNVEAIGLLQRNRAPEADLLLEKALAIDRRNAYTLNNLGFAKEKQGELEAALAYYTAAANMNSAEPIVVTANPDWRGKPISDIARDNAEKVRKELRRSANVEERVARLNLRGVSALNRNERAKAKAFFEQAYKLKPDDAFTLNNMGYLAELDADRETANFYYSRAAEAERAGARVGISTRREVEGRQVGDLAEGSASGVEKRMAAEVEAKRRAGPPTLKRRDGSPVPQRPPQQESNLPEPQPEAQQPNEPQQQNQQPPPS
jgi:Flp pilus assembly protein TadD